MKRSCRQVTGIQYCHKICLINTHKPRARGTEKENVRLDRDGHLHLIKNIIYVDSLSADTKNGIKSLPKGVRRAVWLAWPVVKAIKLVCVPQTPLSLNSLQTGLTPLKKKNLKKKTSERFACVLCS